MNEKKFTITNIQTGDIVIIKDGRRAIVIAGRLKLMRDIFSAKALIDLDNYNNDLTQKNGALQDYDIEKVYRIINCHGCGLDKIINDLPKDKVELIWERKKRIDWSKVPRFTKVQVRDAENEKWKNRYFVGLDSDRSYPYRATVCDKFTFIEGQNSALWKYIRLYDESDIKKEWFE